MKQIITLETKRYLSKFQIHHFWDAFNRAYCIEPNHDRYHVGEAEVGLLKAVSVLIRVDRKENTAVMDISQSFNY
jgi:hypothetical protein